MRPTNKTLKVKRNNGSPTNKTLKVKRNEKPKNNGSPTNKRTVSGKQTHIGGALDEEYIKKTVDKHDINIYKLNVDTETNSNHIVELMTKIDLLQKRVAELTQKLEELTQKKVAELTQRVEELT